jgi:hypothetical protein
MSFSRVIDHEYRDLVGPWSADRGIAEVCWS